jgi:two-component system phosphate regulon sensor histidine kinase PhoR
MPSDIRLTRNGQKLTYQALATRTRGGGVLLVLRNVSTLVNAVQMKTDFVANASHELRTPIAAIKMAFETLQEVRGEDPNQTEKCLGIISGHLNRLEEMLADLLDLSRVESPDLRPSLGAVGSDELFAMVRTTMLTMARQKLVELSFERLPDAPVSFESDRRLLNLILRNLVENAIKFTPAGGRVTISLGAEQDGSTVVLSVEDNGIGIPPQHLERVFERFYQVDAARSSAVGRGTGLGLAIVKHAINALGGTVQLESKVGVGTKVRCRIPYRTPALSDASVTSLPVV